MDTEQEIDFKRIEMLSTKGLSKKYLRKLVEYCFLVRNKLNCLDKNDRTPVTENFSQDLNISDTEAHLLIHNLVKLIERCSQNNFNENEKVFPENFHEELKALLSSLFTNFAPIWNPIIHSDISQANKLIDFDWRLDMQLSTNRAEKISNPVVFFNIDTLSSTEEGVRKSLNFQMNTQDVNNLFNNMKKIKDQLSLLVSSE